MVSIHIIEPPQFLVAQGVAGVFVLIRVTQLFAILGCLSGDVGRLVGSALVSQRAFLLDYLRPNRLVSSTYTLILQHLAGETNTSGACAATDCHRACSPLSISIDRTTGSHTAFVLNRS